MSEVSVVGERLVPERFKVAKKQYLLYLRHLFVYDFAIRELPEESAVLEVGCGEGYGTHLLGRQVRKIVGLDVDEKAVAHARQKYGSANCDFTWYDGVTIPFEEGTFDAAVSFQVIEHVEDDLGFVSRIHRVLKEGGLLILTTPNKTLRLKPGQKPWNRYHKREYYPQELEQVLKSVFPKVEVWGVRGKEEVQRIQQAKFQAGSAVVSFFRRLAPESLKLSLLKIRQGMPAFLGGEEDQDYLSRYGLEDYYIIRQEVGQSLDLLAVCRK